MGDVRWDSGFRDAFAGMTGERGWDAAAKVTEVLCGAGKFLLTIFLYSYIREQD
jgi:hypothetical protein